MEIEIPQSLDMIIEKKEFFRSILRLEDEESDNVSLYNRSRWGMFIQEKYLVEKTGGSLRGRIELLEIAACSPPFIAGRGERKIAEEIARQKGVSVNDYEEREVIYLLDPDNKNYLLIDAIPIRFRKAVSDKKDLPGALSEVHEAYKRMHTYVHSTLEKKE